MQPRLQIELGLAGNELNRTVSAIERLNERLSAAEKTTVLFGESVDTQKNALRTYNNVLQNLLRGGLPTWNKHVHTLKTSIDKLNLALEAQKDIAGQQATMDRLSTKLTQIANNQNLVSDATRRANAELRANQAAIDTLIAQGVDPADARIQKLQQTITGLNSALQATAAASARTGFLQQFQRTGQIIPDLESKIRNLQNALNQATDTRRIAQLNIRLREAQQELEKVRNLGLRAGNSVAQGMNRAATATNRLTVAQRSHQQTAAGLTGQIGGLLSTYLSLYSAMELARRAFSVALQTDAIETSMTFILRNADTAGQKLDMLRKMADRLGLEYVTLAGTYRQFIAATEASNFSMVEAEKIFSAVANAGAKLKLSNEQIQGTFLAIEQMISKGTVSMEELRRQLGDRLPGAFAMAAKAMGVTQPELNDMIRKGEVLAQDLLPKLAEQLNITYGNDTTEKITSLQASVNRLHNEFSDMVEEGNVSKFFEIVVDGVTDSLRVFNKLVNSDSWKEFFYRVASLGVGHSTGMGAVFRQTADAIRDMNEQQERYTKDPIGAYVADFAKESREEMERLLKVQEDIVQMRAETHTNKGTRRNLDELNYQAEILARMRGEYGRMYQLQAAGSENTKKDAAAAKKLTDALIQSEQRLALARTEGEENAEQRVRNWYASRIKLAKDSAAATAQLERNMQAEITILQDRAAEKAKETTAKLLKDRRDQISASARRILEENRKLDAEEAQVSITLQRRLFETRTQIALRELNTEYKERERLINENLTNEILATGKRSEAEAKALKERNAAQEQYYKRREELEAQQREFNVQTAFDGSALSVPLARINEQVKELRHNFQGLNQQEIETFRQKISSLETQRQQLQLFQGTVEDVAGTFGNLFSDMIFNTEDTLKNFGESFQNVAKNMIAGLVKIGARQAINQALSLKSMAATTAAGTATAKALASAYAPAAALAATASFGAAAAAGGAAIATLMATTKALALSGFRSGGYTGNASRNKIAGVVHGQEYVVNAEATRRHMPLLRAINSGVDISGALRTSVGRLGGFGAGQRIDVNIQDIVLSGDKLRVILGRADRSNLLFNGGL